MPWATQQQLDDAEAYYTRMRAAGYSYDRATGAFTAPAQPATPPEEEVRDEDDHRNESSADFELFLLGLKLKAKDRPGDTAAELRKVERRIDMMKRKESGLKLRRAVEERSGNGLYAAAEAVSKALYGDEE